MPVFLQPGCTCHRRLPANAMSDRAPLSRAPSALERSAALRLAAAAVACAGLWLVLWLVGS